MPLRLQFLGCGDAFGTGGRFNTCFYLETSTTHCLIDCGASSLIAMKRFGVAPNAITTWGLSRWDGSIFCALEAHLPAIHAKRLVLTHLSPDMLARAGTLSHEVAEDGKIIEFW